MSKFDCDAFYADGTVIAVSKEKYTKEQAIEIAKFELSVGKNEKCTLCVASAYVRYRYGTDEDGNHRSCYWLEYEKHKRSCPVWVFGIKSKISFYFEDEYEEIELGGKQNETRKWKE